jgi:drug/metabolite transporter (DMT)-like permease
MSPAGSKNTRPFAIWAAMITVYIVWGSTYLAIRFAIETLPPFLMAGVRFLIAGVILYGWRRLSGDKPPTRVEWRSAAVVGTLLLVGGNGGVVWAEQYVPSGIAALLVGSAPLWMALLGAFWLRQGNAGHSLHPLAAAGILTGFAGIALLVGPGQLTGMAGEVHLVGAGVLTAAAFLWAAGSIFSRDAPLPDSPLLGTGMEMLAGGAGLLLLGSLAGEWGRLDPGAISARSLFGVVYLIIFGSLVGFAAYTWLLRVAPTTLVSTYAYVNPLVAILLGSLLAQEPVTPRILISAGVIVGSVALITMTQPLRSKEKPIPEGQPASYGDD